MAVLVNKVCGLAICGLILMVSTVSAVTYTVTKTADTNDGFCDADCSLREAVFLADTGDTIIFSPLFNSPQTITLGGTQLVINFSFSITGPGSSLLTVGGNNLSRIFQINAGSTVSISGMKITGGNPGLGGNGGAIRNSGSLNLTDVDVNGNTADQNGGGIYSTSNLTLLNSVVRNNNAAKNKGGGIYHGNGTLTITNSAVSNNACPDTIASNGHGGGLEFGFGTGTITGSTFTGNQASNIGGGISIEEGTLTITNSTVSGNSATQFGGGISIGRSCVAPTPCSLTVNNSTISGNTATTGAGGTGGGIGAEFDSTLTVNSSTISGNTSGGTTGGSGGGIFAAGISSTISNSTISGNTSRNTGGVVLESATSNLLTNSTVSNNTANSATGIGGISGGGFGVATVRSSIIAGNVSNTTKPDVNGTFISSGYNLIGNVGTAVGFVLIGDQTGTGASPINPRLDALSNYGGTMQTHRLQTSPVSPAIDAGNSFGLTTEQRGTMRTIDFPGVPFALLGDNTDIGAVEAAVPTAAMVGISGRVITAQGNGIRNAFVMLTDSSGNMRAVKSSSFGYYSFNDIEVGHTYIISVASKRFQFATQIISLSGEMTNVDFIAQ